MSNIDHFCAPANLAKTIDRIDSRLHPKLAGPLAPRGKPRRPLRVFPYVATHRFERRRSQRSMRLGQSAEPYRAPSRKPAALPPTRPLESACPGHVRPCLLYRLRNMRLKDRSQQSLGRARPGAHAAIQKAHDPSSARKAAIRSADGISRSINSMIIGVRPKRFSASEGVKARSEETYDARLP